MKNGYYNNRKLFLSICWIIAGAVLAVLGYTGVIKDDVWATMGIALAAVGILQVIRNLSYRNNPEYKKKIDISAGDERNSFLRMKAWSWTGYLFVLGAAVVSLVMFATDHREIGQVISFCMCAELFLYYAAYIILGHKY